VSKRFQLFGESFAPCMHNISRLFDIDSSQGGIPRDSHVLRIRLPSLKSLVDLRH